MNNIWLVLCLFSSSVLSSERNPFRPPDAGQLCRVLTSSEAEWQLQGTLLQQDRQAVRMHHPQYGHYFLLAGQFLPGTLWQVAQIDRRRVVLRQSPECPFPTWVMTMTKGYRNEG